MKRICSCGIVFDSESQEKKEAGGLVNDCPECATEKTGKYSGVMIWNHKTAPALQINSPTPEGAALTAYLNSGNKSQRSGLVPPPAFGAMVRPAEVAQSRRGDSDLEKKCSKETVPSFASPWRPGCNAEPPKNVQMMWLDPTSRIVYKIMDGRMFEAKIDQVLAFAPSKSRMHDKLATQKGVLAKAISTVNELLGVKSK